MNRSEQPRSPGAELTRDGGDIRIKKLSHVVADRLRAQIVTGQRKPGDRLPPESELLTQFNVSRPILREALRILEVESLITLGRGMRSGASVNGPTIERAAEYASMVLVSAGTTLQELHEARAIIEPRVIFLLTKNNSAHFAEALKPHGDAIAAAVDAGDFEGVSQATSDFHAALGRASENTTLVLLVGMLELLSGGGVSILNEGNARQQTAVRSTMLKSVEAYQGLVDLIRRGKAAEAEAHWSGYMEEVRAFLVRSGIGIRKLQHRSGGGTR